MSPGERGGSAPCLVPVRRPYAARTWFPDPELFAEVDPEDAARVLAVAPWGTWTLATSQRTSPAEAGIPWAVHALVGRRTFRLPRLILGLHGEGRGRTVIPADANPLNLRRANLRIVNHAELAQMRRDRIEANTGPPWAWWEGSSWGGRT